MRKCKLFCGCVVFLGLYVPVAGIAAEETLSFPGAEGFGRHATGGRGGDVYHVMNLADTGEGSLRQGIESAHGPRTIVFDLSGTIALNSDLRIDRPGITIAGQTAPGDGITLRNYPLVVNADNIIVRYIRSRLGDEGEQNDAISIAGGTSIIFDHCSASWSIDEVLSDQSDTTDLVTVQWCMITEGLNDSIHEKGPHGKGGIIGGLRQSYHHNLYAHNDMRSPKVTWRRHCKVDFRNNVIYNWKHKSCFDGAVSHMNWVNNYYKPGPATKESVRNTIFMLSNKDDAPDAKRYEAKLYAAGNFMEGAPAISADNWSGGIQYYRGGNEAQCRVDTPFNYPPITEQTPEKAFALVLSYAGASLTRDTHDTRIVEEVRNGIATYGKDGIIDSQDDAGGWPVLKSLPPPSDTDRDGIPDSWEQKNGLDPRNPEDRNDIPEQDCYTNLERYLNSLCPMPY